MAWRYSGSDQDTYWWLDEGEPAPAFWVSWPQSYHHESGNEIPAQWKTPDPRFRSPYGEWRTWASSVESGAYNSDGQPYYVDRGAPTNAPIVTYAEYSDIWSPFWLGRYDFERDYWLRAFVDIYLEVGTDEPWLLLVAQNTGWWDRFPSFNDLTTWRALQARYGADVLSGESPRDFLGRLIERAQYESAHSMRQQTVSLISIFAAPLFYYLMVAEAAAAASAAAEASTASTASAAAAETSAASSATVTVEAAGAGEVIGEVAMADMLGLSTTADIAAVEASIAALPAAAAPALQLPQAVQSVVNAAQNIVQAAVTGELVSRIREELRPSPPARPAPSQPEIDPERALDANPWPALILAGAAAFVMLS